MSASRPAVGPCHAQAGGLRRFRHSPEGGSHGIVTARGDHARRRARTPHQPAARNCRIAKTATRSATAIVSARAAGARSAQNSSRTMALPTTHASSTSVNRRSEHIRRGEIDVRLFSTIMTLGTPQDVTLQELRIETFLPADPESEAMIRAVRQEA